jgi:signal transduction histidine kinase
MTHSRRPKQESLLNNFCDPLEMSLEHPHPALALVAAKRQVETATSAAREATLRAKAADYAKTSFLANMSHELRTPLNAIIGFSELIKHDRVEARERYSEYAGYIYDAGLSLLRLVTAILNLARIEAGKYQLAEELVPIGDLVEGALRALRPLAEEKSIATQFTIETPSALVAVDPSEINQALLNVLNNAVKYTPRGGRLTVDVRRDRAGDLLITVEDTGPGIPSAQLSRVLEPFGQHETPLTRRLAGVGLGLPIAKALMALHGGELVIDSKRGRGTTVELRLPGARVHAPTAAEYA